MGVLALSACALRVPCVCPACAPRVSACPASCAPALLRLRSDKQEERKMNRAEIVKNILTNNLQACDPKIDEYLKLLSEHGADLCWYVHLFLSPFFHVHLAYSSHHQIVI